jgi:transcriptional regulator with XRE-family HTH domain
MSSALIGFFSEILLDTLQLLRQGTQSLALSVSLVLAWMPCSGISHISMATTLAPVNSREVVRCDHCALVQFRTINGLCRRCHTSLDHEDPPLIESTTAVPPLTAEEGPSPRVANAIRTLRQRSGLSQRQLALRMQVPRTYVSKIENEKATPTLSSLKRLAEALDVTVPDLLAGGQRQGESVRELMADGFIAELIPYLPRLNPLQWQSVLAQVRDMAVHTHRSA